MFGFFIGTACLIGLWAVARKGHHRHGGWPRHHRGFGRRHVVRRVLDRLDTTPGQEKVIRNALHELGEEMWTLRREARSTRGEIAAALRGPELDKDLLERVFAKHDELIERLRASTVRTAEQVHGTLDDRQRKEFADLIEGRHWGYAC